MHRLVARIVAWWTRRQMERAVPGLAAVNRAIEDRRRRHLPTRDLIAARKQLVTTQLAKEAAACRRT